MIFPSLTLQQGTFNQGAGQIKLGTYNQSGGTFNGGTYNSGTNLNSIGSFTLTGGNFNAAPTTTFSGNFTHTTAAGNFNEGTGTVFFFSTFNGTSGIFDVNGSETFYNVNFRSGNGTNIAAGDTLVVSNTATLQGGTLNGGTLEAKGSVTTLAVGSGGSFQGGTASVLFSGAANQTFSNPQGGATFGGTWTINKPNSAPSFADSYAPAAPTNLLLSGNVGNTTLNSYPAFNIVSGNVVQTGNFSHAFASLSIAAGTSFVNEFGGTLTLAGNSTNNGNINFDGGGSGCPQADAIVVRSSIAGTQRQWSGAGAYRLVDIDLKDQISTNMLNVYNGTNSGNNTNFAFNGGCLAPTAASVSIGGRVTKADGRGVARAQMVMVDANGQARYAMTNPLGFYRFEDVPVGQTFVLTVNHKTERFAAPTQILNVFDEASSVDFTALEK